MALSTYHNGTHSSIRICHCFTLCFSLSFHQPLHPSSSLSLSLYPSLPHSFSINIPLYQYPSLSTPLCLPLSPSLFVLQSLSLSSSLYTPPLSPPFSLSPILPSPSTLLLQPGTSPAHYNILVSQFPLLSVVPLHAARLLPASSRPAFVTLLPPPCLHQNKVPCDFTASPQKRAHSPTPAPSAPQRSISV